MTPARQPQPGESHCARDHCKREFRCYANPRKPCTAVHCEYDTRSRPHTPAPTAEFTDAENKWCDDYAVAYNRGFDAGASKAREECIKHQRKIEDKIVHGIKLSDEQFRGIDKIFSESIKSLRSTQHQAGERR